MRSGSLPLAGASILLFSAFLSPAASAQPRTQAQRITGPIKSAGVYHAATGSWTRGNSHAAFGPDVIYNNTTAALYFLPVGDDLTTPGGFEVTDAGRLPSTFDVGDGDRYMIDGMSFAYCSTAGVGSGLSVTVGFDEAYDPCSGAGAGSSGSLTFTGLPSSSTAGSMACWIVTIDLMGTTQTLSVQADGEGVFDNSSSLDNFGCTLSMSGQGSDPQTGFIFAGDPNNAPFGDGTTNFGFGPGPDGTGLGQEDSLWIQNGGGVSGCTNLGGYPGGPWTGLYTRLMGDAEAGVTSLVFDGLVNEAVGSSTLDLIPGGGLRVSNIGSSGLDGVRIQLDESEGFRVSARLDPGQTGQMELGLRTEILLQGASNTVPISLTVTDTPSMGTRAMLPDFSAIGSQSYTLRLYLDGDVVYDQSGHSGPTFMNYVPPNDIVLPYDLYSVNPDGIDWDRGALCIWTSTTHAFQPPAGSSVLANFADFVPDGSFPPVASSPEVVLTGSGFSDLSIVSEEVRMFDHWHQGQGGAFLHAVAGHMTVDNLGSSGNDGVAIQFSPTGGPCPWNLQIGFSPIDLSLTGSVIGATLVGANGLPLGGAQFGNKDQCSNGFYVEYEGSSTLVDLTFYDNGQWVGSAQGVLPIGPCNPPISPKVAELLTATGQGFPSPWYIGFGEDPDTGEDNTWFFRLHNNADIYSVVASGGGQSVFWATADEIRMSSGTTAAVESIQVEGEDIDEFTIEEESVNTVTTGNSYCIATPNSTGQGAVMSAGCSSPSIGVNDIKLRGYFLPVNQFGIFYYGPNQIQAPFGNGFRCVGGSTVRLPVLNSGPSGTLSYDMDLTSPQDAPIPPTPGGVWNFQCWYRDPAGGGSSYNLSDGLGIAFSL